MLFVSALNVPEVTQALQEAGFGAREQGAGGVVVSKGDAYVWIQISSPGELGPAELEDEDEWPIALDQLGSFFNISVRRSAESEDLAVRVAHRLATRFEGMIMWDGMDQWESRYKTYVASNCDSLS